jgi:hypothetical protein
MVASFVGKENVFYGRLHSADKGANLGKRPEATRLNYLFATIVTDDQPGCLIADLIDLA